MQKKVKKAAGANENGTNNARREIDDDDPLGHKILQVDDPLRHAATMLRVLEDLRSDQIGVWLAAFDIALRRGRYLQATRALQAARKLDSQNPNLHWRVIKFRVISSSWAEGIVKQSIEKALDTMLPANIPLELINSGFLQLHPGDIHVISAVVKAGKLLNSEGQFTEELFLTAFDEVSNLDIQVAQGILEELHSKGSCKATRFALKCQKRFPLCPSFTEAFDGPNVSIELSANAVDNYEILF